MNTIKLSGQVDENHRLSAEVPDSIPPGPVTVLIVPVSQEDNAGDAWMTSIAREWSDDLTDNCAIYFSEPSTRRERLKSEPITWPC